MSERIPIRALATYQGQGNRPSQEDYALAIEDKGVFAVADGFGGPKPGSEAARTACESVRDFLVREAGDLDATLPFVLRQYFSLAGNVLFNALIHANRKVTALNRSKSVHEKGGASVVAGFLDGDLLALANVGSCTAWLLRGGDAVELVVPKTYARLWNPFDAPDLSGAESRNIPLMALGITDDLEPEIVECRVRPGDWLLLHTDGLTRELRDQVRQLQILGLSPDQASAEVAQALKIGKVSDNACATVVMF